MKLNKREALALLRRDFPSFVEQCFYELNPGAVFHPHWSIELMAARIELVVSGETLRLIINVPPRHLKSLIVSIALPAFLLGLDPAAQIICVSYSQDLAEKFSRDCRAVVLTGWYQQLFPRTRLSPTRQAVNEFETTEHGFRKATSVGGVLTGRGADYILIDDPLKPEEALSEAQRTSVNDWYSHTLYSRLNDKRTGRIVVVMQRLHPDDLTGHLLEQGGFELLTLPAIAQMDEVHVIETIVGRRRFARRKGEALQPDREPLESLEMTRQSLGAFAFASQYLQAPQPPEGNMVNPAWLKYYLPNELPARFDQIVLSVDSANKVSELADYTVFTIWGVKRPRFYLLHLVRRKMEYPELKRALKQMADQYQATVILIEDRASGTQLVQELHSEGYHSVRACKPEGDKVMRFHAQTAAFESGCVWLPKEAPWLDDLVQELISFPAVKHDDQVDSVAQALAHCSIPSSAENWIEYMRREAERAWGIEHPSVRVRAPVGVSHLHALSGRRYSVPNDRILLLTESDAQPLFGAGWERLDD